MSPLPHKNFIYFSLGSISTLAIFFNKPISLLNVLSLSSFLLFIFLDQNEHKDTHENEHKNTHRNTHKFNNFLNLEDLLILFAGLILEFTFLSNTFLNFINFKIINFISGSLMIIFFLLIIISLYFINFTLNNLHLNIRHPLYSFISFFIISSCVYAKCFCLLSFYALKIQKDLIKRIREEEKMKIKENPEYVQYRKEVWSGIIGMK